MKKFIGLLFIIILAGAGYYGYVHYWPSNEIAVFNPQNRQMVYMEGIPQAEHDIFIEQQGELLLKASFIEGYADANMENNQPVDETMSMQMINDEPYLPMSFIGPFLNIDWLYSDQYQVLIMEEQRECRLMAEVIVEEALIRQEPSIKAPYFDVTIVPGDTSLVYETHEKWLKIRTEEGLIGFIHKKDVKRYEECRPRFEPASER